MTWSPSYYRARLDLITDLISGLDKDPLQKSNDVVLLRNGFVPTRFNENELVIKRKDKGRYPEEPLSFSELTRFNSWFTLHPEKICGEEHVTTSLEFPIKVKGSREDIIRIIRGNEHISDLEMQALVAEVELQLLQL